MDSVGVVKENDLEQHNKESFKKCENDSNLSDKNAKENKDQSNPKPKIIRVTSNEEYKCTECDFVTNKRLMLKKHCIVHHADKLDEVLLLNQFKCDFCDKVFKCPIQLSNHKNVHLGLKPYKCVECDHNFTTRGELIRHTRYKHTLERPHKCPTCDYSSVELSKLKRHIRVHTDERPYLCPYCDYASRDTFKLKRHLRVHTGEKPYECPICKAAFSQSNSLKVHMKGSHEEGSRIQKRSAKKARLELKNANNPAVNTENKLTLPADQTIIIPDATSAVMNNVNNASTTNKSTYYSSVHESYYTNQDYIKNLNEIGEEVNNHINHTTFVQNDVVFDEDKDVFTCSECLMKFMSQELLNEHFVKHSGARPFQCEICNMKFGAKFALRSHILSHNIEYSEKLSAKLKKINENAQAMTTSNQYNDDQTSNSSSSEAHSNVNKEKQKTSPNPSVVSDQLSNEIVQPNDETLERNAADKPEFSNENDSDKATKEVHNGQISEKAENNKNGLLLEKESNSKSPKGMNKSKRKSQTPQRKSPRLSTT